MARPSFQGPCPRSDTAPLCSAAGRHAPDAPRSQRLLSDEGSNVLIHLSGALESAALALHAKGCPAGGAAGVLGRTLPWQRRHSRLDVANVTAGGSRVSHSSSPGHGGDEFMKFNDVEELLAQVIGSHVDYAPVR
jgi:hypothetical protein